MPDSVVPYDRILSTLTGSLTAIMHDRHVAAVEMILRVHSSGLPVGDLAQVATVLRAAITRSQDADSQLGPALAKLLRLAARSYQPYSVVDAARAVEPAADLVAAASVALWHPLMDVQTAALEVITAYSPSGVHGGGTLGTRPLERSPAVSTLMTLLPRVQHPEFRLSIFRCLRMCATLESQARLMVEHGLLELALDALTADVRAPLASEAVSILGSLMENVPAAVTLLGSLRALTALQTTLSWLLLNGHSLADREMRNDILVLLNMLAEDNANHANFVESTLLETVLLIGTARELQVQHPAARPFLLDCTVPELEAAQLAWSTAALLARSDACRAKVSQARLVSVLLMYADVESRYSLLDGWSAPQRAMLRSAAYALLPALGRLLPDDLVRSNGPRVLLQAALCPDLPTGNVAVACVLAVADLCREGLVQAGAIGTLLAVIRDERGRPAPTRRDALGALATLCDGQAEQQAAALRGGAVPALLPYLQPALGSLEASEHFLLVSIDCVWRVLLRNFQGTDAFVEADGLHLLLELLASKSALLVVPLLGALADALEVPQAVARARSWVGPQGQSLGRVLAALWMQEDARYHVEYDRDVVLRDPSCPLINIHALREMPTAGDAALAASVAPDAMPADLRQQLLSRVLGSDLRFKLYVLLEKTGFTHWKDLTPPERARLMVAAKFMALRDGVMWREVAAELEDEGVRPISPDLERCQAAVVAAEELAEQLQQEQRALLGRVDDLHRETERELARSLQTLRESQRSLRETLAMRSAGKPKTMPTRRRPMASTTPTGLPPSQLHELQQPSPTAEERQKHDLDTFLRDDVVAAMAAAPAATVNHA